MTGAPILQLPEAANQLTEETSRAVACEIRWQAIQMPPEIPPEIPTTGAMAASAVATSYVCLGAEGSHDLPPLLLLHGFDSSLFEFRRLLPLLAAHRRVYAMDLLGFGFCDRTVTPQVTPGIIKQHLRCFCEQVIGQPVVLVGASMGGGVAIDFAVSYPEAVRQLVLIDAVGFATGPAIGKLMFPPLDRWATNFLRSPRVRRKISENAYFDKSFVTPDAELCAALHLQMPHWQTALIAFTKSGGYNFLAPKISQISLPTLVLWGAQDKILGTRDAHRFAQTIDACKLVWIDRCGHVPHLEKASVTAEHIVQFVA